MISKNPIGFFKLYKFFLSMQGVRKASYFRVYFFSLLHPLSNPFSVLFTSLAISFLAAGKFDTLLPLWLYIGGNALMDLISIIVLRCYQPSLDWHHQKAYNDIVKTALCHIKTLGLDWYARMNGGDIIHRVTRGAEGLGNMMRVILNTLVHETIRAVMTIAMTLYFLHDPTFLAGVAAYLFFSYLAIRHFRDSIYRNHTAYKEIEKNAFNNIFNFAAGFSTIKLANLSDYFIDRTVQSLEDGPPIKRKNQNIISVRQMMLRGLQYILYIGLFAYVGLLITQGKAQVGVLMLVFGLLQNTAKWLQDFVSVETAYLENKSYFESLFDILQEKPSFEDSPDARELKASWDDIAFCHVCFRYGELSGKNALSDVDLSIRRGRVTAFVGESGSGKSTLAKLLLRQYRPQTGQVTIGIQDLSELKTSAIYGAFGYLPQDTEIFDLSFLENITFGIEKGARSIDDLVRIAHLQDIIDHLPHGMDTLVGARGIKLSGGERQRLGLARMLYQDRDIYIFDECTSQLDGVTEDIVLQNIHEALKGKTLIWIAHRLYTIKHADDIVVLQEGRIAETGSHAMLLGKQGAYATLWNKQQQ